MASRKYKPALFELVKKGPLKPDQTGALKVPRWFGKQSGPAKVVAQPKLPVEQPRFVPPTESSADVDEPRVRLSAGTGKLDFSVSYITAGLLVLALLLLLALTYRLGYKHGFDYIPGADAPASDSAAVEPDAPAAVNRLVNSEPRPEVWQRPVPTAAPAAAVTPAAPARTEPIVPAVPQKGNVLVCASGKTGDLEPLQDYFAANGISCGIGRLGSVNVLVTRASFEGRNDPQYAATKKQVARVGALYNQNKPKDAASFSESTFASAYLVSVDKIR